MARCISHVTNFVSFFFFKKYLCKDHFDESEKPCELNLIITFKNLMGILVKLYLTLITKRLLL